MRRAYAVSLGCLLGLGLTAQFAGATCDSAYVSHNGSTWTVLPTGIDDADNLACAFDEAVAAGSGSVVRLVAAEYVLLRPIAVRYEGDLTWRGAGRNRTIINAGSEATLFPLLVKEGYYPEPGSPSVIVFHQDEDGWVGPDGEALTSKLLLKGFTIRLRGLSESWEDAFGTISQTRSIIDVTGRIDGLRNFEASRVQLTMDHVRLQGEDCAGGVCGFLDWTAHNGLTVGGEPVITIDGEGRALIEYSKPLVADTDIAYCVFERIGFAAGHTDAEESSIQVFDSRFTDVGVAYFLQDANGGRVNVWRNQMSGIAYYGIIVIHGLTGVFGNEMGPVTERFPTTTTGIEISKNTICCTGELAECVVIEDYTVLNLPENQLMLEADVAENFIKLTAPAYAAVGSYYSRGVNIFGNIIVGEGVAGIYTHFGGYWTIVGNLVSIRSGIPIWLEEQSTDSAIDRNLILGRGGDAAIQIDGVGHQVSGNFVRWFRPNVAHYWLTATSAQNDLVVAEVDTVLEEGTENTVTLEIAPAP